MRPYLILVLFSFLAASCSTSEEDVPMLEIASIFINGEDEDYSGDPSEMPILKVGDEADITLILSADVNDLKAFNLISGSKNVRTTLFFYSDEVSDEFTNITEGIVGFKDGVRDTWITVKMKVLKVPVANKTPGEEVKLSFFLSCKSHDSEGAQAELNFITGTEAPVE